MSARWIRSKQRDDGTWAQLLRRPRPTSRPRSRRTPRCGSPATRSTPAHGARARVHPRRGRPRADARLHPIWLALFGLWSWDDVPAMPPELILLPPSRPAQHLRLRAAGRARRSWRSRSSPRSSRSGPCRSPSTSCGRGRRRSRSSRSRPGRVRSGGSTACCTSTSGGRSSALRRAALQKAERWIVDRQEADGSWGGIQPPWVYSLIALHLLGYPLDHPVIQQGPRGPRQVHDRRGRRCGGSRPASRRSGTRRSR